MCSSCGFSRPALGTRVSTAVRWRNGAGWRVAGTALESGGRGEPGCCSSCQVSCWRRGGEVLSEGASSRVWEKQRFLHRAEILGFFAWSVPFKGKWGIRRICHILPNQLSWYLCLQQQMSNTSQQREPQPLLSYVTRCPWAAVQCWIQSSSLFPVLLGVQI